MQKTLNVYDSLTAVGIKQRKCWTSSREELRDFLQAIQAPFARTRNEFHTCQGLI